MRIKSDILAFMNSYDKLDVRLIALDLDDTLLNDNREITDMTVEALRECVNRGIYVVLCSGRAEDAILPFVRRLEIAGKEAGRYLIAINGCSIFDLHKRQQIFCRKVEADILLRTNQVAEARGLRSEVYTPDTIYYREETKWTKLDVDLLQRCLFRENLQNFLNCRVNFVLSLEIVPLFLQVNHTSSKFFLRIAVRERR